MRKLLGCFLVVMLLVFGMSAIAAAMPTDPTPYDAVCNGTYVGTFSGNDNDYSPPGGYSLLTGVEVSDKSFDPVNWGSTQEGYWYAGSSTVYYYSVKAGPQYAVRSYTGIGGSSLGCWTTEPLLVGSGQQPGISHISFFGTQGVPEPATLLLLGSGLVGLAMFGRKRFKN
jgi:hypothetical protein